MTKEEIMQAIESMTVLELSELSLLPLRLLPALLAVRSSLSSTLF